MQWPHGLGPALTLAQCPGVARWSDWVYWCFGKILSFLWALFSHPVVLGVYARLRLLSRFLKLLGLSFISANWIEYSWPFQWNQLTPCKKEETLKLVSAKQDVHWPLLFSLFKQKSFATTCLCGVTQQLPLASLVHWSVLWNFQRHQLNLTRCLTIGQKSPEFALSSGRPSWNKMLAINLVF